MASKGGSMPTTTPSLYYHYYNAQQEVLLAWNGMEWKRGALRIEIYNPMSSSPVGVASYINMPESFF